MNKLLLLNLFLFFSIAGFGQCPTTNIILSSQADVDAFTTSYPGCTQLTNTIIISGADIIDLSALSVLTEVVDIRIYDNPLLPNLTGLENITNYHDGNWGEIYIVNNSILHSIVGLSGLNQPPNGNGVTPIDISISDNPLLQSLDGLQGITGIMYSLYISNNDLLTNLQGLNGLVGADDFVIQDNGALVNFVGVDSLIIIGGIHIINNDSLVSFEGFNSVFPYCGLDIRDNLILNDIDFLTDNFEYLCGVNFIIEDNLELSFCSSNYVCQALPFAETISINNNAVGCNSETEIIDNCQTCPPGTVILTTQAEVDAFAIDFPGCTQILDGLIIDGNGINDLSALSNLLIIENGLLIQNTYNLINFQGLDNVLSVDNLSIINNDNLEDISALNNLFVESIELIEIRENNNLSECNIYAVCKFLDNGGTVVINNNDNGCNNIAQLEEKCFNYYGDVVLITQEQVDSFPDDFPLFHQFGNITIEGPDIISLTTLSQIESLLGVFEIKNNPNLQTLAGLENLEGNGLGTIFENNSILQDFDALDSFWFIGSYMYINNNDSLSNLSGLNNIITSGGQIMKFEDNDHLINFEGLAPINFLGSLWIRNNSSLQSLSGITGYTGSTLQIENNPSLSICNIDTFCEYIIQYGTLPGVIMNNASGCNSGNDIQQACNLSVSEFDLQKEIIVNPNPVSEKLRIFISENVLFEKAIVYSVLGKKLLEVSEKSIDLSNLSEGLYFVKINTDKGTITKRIIIE